MLLERLSSGLCSSNLCDMGRSVGQGEAAARTAACRPPPDGSRSLLQRRRCVAGQLPQPRWVIAATFRCSQTVADAVRGAAERQGMLRVVSEAVLARFLKTSGIRNRSAAQDTPEENDS